MASTPIAEMMDTILEKVKGIVDSNTIIGKPIVCEDGTIILPVTKVSMGAGSGGTEWQSKEPKNEKLPFGGGSGLGVTITPMAVLVVKNGHVNLVSMDGGKEDGYDKLLGILPDAIEKIKGLFSKNK